MDTTDVTSGTDDMYGTLGYWNFRMMERTNHGETEIVIVEAYYNAAGDVISWTENAHEAMGETVASLRWELERMLEAVDKPLLDSDGKPVTSVNG